MKAPRILHLESTDVCNLECPLCARTVDPAFDKNKQHHLTIDQVRQHLSESDILGLEKMFICGNYGDPAAGKYTLDLFRYFREINPNITLGMNSSGSIRNTGWWTELAEILSQPRDYVVFSIDGLADTNHFYRVNSQWNKIMDNAGAFIHAGGGAHWDMLVYSYNEHQVEQAEQLARDLGFKWFRTKISKRPTTATLKMPSYWQHSAANVGEISCQALKEQSVYIDAQGRISPCCWLASDQTNLVNSIDQVSASWTSSNPHPVCLATCGTRESVTNFKKQWNLEVELCS